MALTDDAKQKPRRRWDKHDRWLMYLLGCGIALGLTIGGIQEFMTRSRAAQWEAALLAKLGEAPTHDELTAWLDDRGAGYRNFTPDVVQIEYLLWTGLAGTKPHFATTLLGRGEPADAIELNIHTGNPQILPGPHPVQWFNRIIETAPCMVWGVVFIWVIIVSERRSLRLNRGCCPQCGYPIGTSDVCSECGESLPNTRLPGVARQARERLRRTRVERPEP